MEWFACSWACSRVFARCDMNGFFLHAYGLCKNEMNVMVSTSDVRLFEVGFLPWVRCYFVGVPPGDFCEHLSHPHAFQVSATSTKIRGTDVRNQKFSTCHLHPQKSKYLTKGSHQADFLGSRAVFAVPLYRYAQQRPVLRVALAGR